MKKGQGFVRRVTLENLIQFKLLLELEKNEEIKTNITRQYKKKSAELEAIDKLFLGEKIKLKIPFKLLKRKIGTHGKLKKQPITKKIELGQTNFTPRTILWQKQLAPSDVQSQSGHPTGGLRLTQAKWKVGGQLINQTKYFRNDLFGHLPWSIFKVSPRVEQIEVKFEVIINGKNYNIFKLRISDKQSGEAGQGNYTSILHWGDLAGVIRSLNLKGKLLKLFAPLQGKDTYLIDIS